MMGNDIVIGHANDRGGGGQRSRGRESLLFSGKLLAEKVLK